MLPLTRVTIIVEWYNMTYAEAARARHLLESVREQATETLRLAGTSGQRPAVELIIAHDADRVCAADIESALGGALRTDSAMSLQLLAVRNATYCRLKNAAAQIATADVVVFLDCDVIPEPGWLETITSPFADPSVDVVVGNTYVDCEDGKTYSRAMALTWMFPLRDGRGLRDAWGRSSVFYANNLAVRRCVFVSNPFPDTPGLTHHPATLWALHLLGEHTAIWYAPARASHPPPNGPVHFYQRAVAGGRARAITAQERGLRRWLVWGRADLEQVAWGWKRLLTQGRQVGLRAWQVPAALCMSVAYVLCFYLGSVATDTFPAYMRRRFVM